MFLGFVFLLHTNCSDLLRGEGTLSFYNRASHDDGTPPQKKNNGHLATL